jgi:hypothetical protein
MSQRSQSGQLSGSSGFLSSLGGFFSWVAFCAWSGPWRTLGGLLAAGGGTWAPVFFSSDFWISCCGFLLRSGTNCFQ